MKQKITLTDFKRWLQSAKNHGITLKSTVYNKANEAHLTVHKVIDSGYSHNKPGTFAATAIGPHWPEELQPVTGNLKIYR